MLQRDVRSREERDKTKSTRSLILAQQQTAFKNKPLTLIVLNETFLRRWMLGATFKLDSIVQSCLYTTVIISALIRTSRATYPATLLSSHQRLNHMKTKQGVWITLGDSLNSARQDKSWHKIQTPCTSWMVSNFKTSWTQLENASMCWNKLNITSPQQYAVLLFLRQLLLSRQCERRLMFSQMNWKSALKTPTLYTAHGITVKQVPAVSKKIKIIDAWTVSLWHTNTAVICPVSH